MSAQGLPAHILTLFGPRPPAEPLPKQLTCHARRREISGCAEYMGEFEETDPPPRPTYEAPRERKIRVLKEKYEAHMQKIADLRNEYDPKNDTKATGDPLKTVFVGRISYDTSEKKLKREFEAYGSVKSLTMVYDQKSGKPRGYAFIEYEDERDARKAYKEADGKKIDGRRVMVDVERGRTSEGWYPRRLAGGRGSGRKVKTEKGRRQQELVTGAGSSKDPKSTRDRERARDRGGDRDRERDRERAAGGDRDRGGGGGDRERERRGDRDRERMGERPGVGAGDAYRRGGGPPGMDDRRRDDRRREDGREKRGRDERDDRGEKRRRRDE